MSRHQLTSVLLPPDFGQYSGHLSLQGLVQSPICIVILTLEPYQATVIPSESDILGASSIKDSRILIDDLTQRYRSALIPGQCEGGS